MITKITVKEWLDREFPPGSSRPTPRTVTRMIKRGELKAKKFGRKWYILTEVTTGNAECDEILRAIS